MRDLVRSVNKLVEAKIEAEFHLTSATELGLSKQSVYKIWANSTGVIIRKSEMNAFNYYSGAEYVDTRYVSVIGDYVFYSSDDDRVAGWIDSGEIEFE